MPENEYRRLARARARPDWSALFSRSSLWVGRDHLLNLETNGYSESYRRFYFRDIQALSLRQTPRWISLAVAMAVAVLCWLILAALIEEPVLRYIFLALAGVFLLAAILNLSAGPTCLVHVQTAVQLELLPALSRLRQTRKVLAQVRPLIQSAQGLLTSPQVEALCRQEPFPNHIADSSASESGDHAAGNKEQGS